jgi:hypothetical protein
MLATVPSITLLEAPGSFVNRISRLIKPCFQFARLSYQN